jgi:hypothetical protein
MEAVKPSETARVKYVYVDVVGFTAGRSVEAQSYIVEKMNAIVREATQGSGAAEDQTIFIPTGDGIAIALIEQPGLHPYQNSGANIKGCCRAQHVRRSEVPSI